MGADHIWPHLIAMSATLAAPSRGKIRLSGYLDDHHQRESSFKMTAWMLDFFTQTLRETSLWRN
jgi:hypothetical protein